MNTQAPIAVAIFIAIAGIISVGGLAFLLIRNALRQRPAFKAYGIEFHLDGVQHPQNLGEIQDQIQAYVQGMREVFESARVYAALRGLRVNLVTHLDPSIRADLKLEKLTGLTYGMDRIDVVVEPQFLADGRPCKRLDLEDTAFFYEVTNVLVWRFYDYETAFAESLLDPENLVHQRLVGDANGDGRLTPEDVEARMAVRAGIDSVLNTTLDAIRRDYASPSR